MPPPFGRASAVVLAVVVAGLLLVGCSGTDGSEGDAGDAGNEGGAAAPGSTSAEPSPSAPGTPSTPTAPPGPPSGTDPATPPAGREPLACATVRAGIDAFNAGDLDETVARFADAVPLAERDARQRPAEVFDLLVEAVRYYAELPTEDYIEASVSSPEFLRWKALTLGVCEYAGPPSDSPTDDTIPA